MCAISANHFRGSADRREQTGELVKVTTPTWHARDRFADEWARDALQNPQATNG